MSRRTAESNKAILAAWNKEQESGLQNNSKILLKKAKLMMTMALHFKVSI